MTLTIAATTPAICEPPLNVEEEVKEYFADIPIMAEIAKCESSFRHYLDDGTVLRGRVNPKDVGVMQINTYYHGEQAENLGLDLLDLKENMEYARHLYNKRGTRDWFWSEHCWGVV